MSIQDILSENQKRLLALNSEVQPIRREPTQAEHLKRCKTDFAYWAATCCYIKRKGGGEDILFNLNRPQRKLVATLEKMRTLNQPIRLILLKARQWGGSTCTQIYMSWLQMIHMEGLNSLIIAHQHTATAEIRDMFVRMIENYPADMLEVSPIMVRKHLGGAKRTENAGPGTIRVPSFNFKVKVGSAERPDSCRGGDYSLVHCSEVALWRKTKLKTPEDMLRAACSGVLLQPMTMILLESTANGTGNFFHTEYEAAKRGESQFQPLFIPWYEIEQYVLPFSEGEREEFARHLLEGKDNPQPLSSRQQPGAYLWWLWEKGASLEAIHWYVNERRKYSDHAQMAAEYPSDDVEAFAHSGARVFDRYKVELLRPDCKSVFKRGEICGEIPFGPKSLENIKFREDSQGALKMWKDRDNENEYSNRYLVVVDIGGRSASADWSVIVVFDRLGMLSGGRPEVVAQWRGHTYFDILAWNAARIAKYYHEALLVIESNTLETRDRERLVEGDQSHYLLNQIRQAYSNLYARSRSPEEIRLGSPLKYGFHTNVATKPMIISNLVSVIRESLYIERDEECLDEFLTYEQRQDGSYGAISGKHDDLLMTRAIGLHICFNEMPMPSARLINTAGYYFRSRPYSSAAYF